MNNLITDLPLSETAKAYFNDFELYEILEKPIIICDNDDIEKFFEAILHSRKKYISDSGIKKKMIFYTWYDQMSGQICFSVIPVDWSKMPFGKDLPFRCKVSNVEKLEDIIEEHEEDNYRGSIPMDELNMLDEKNELKKTTSDKNQGEFVLKVWSKILEPTSLGDF